MAGRLIDSIETHVITHLSVIACLVASPLPPAGASHLLKAGRTSKPPKIDGYLTDRCWKRAKPVGGFTQYAPEEGARSREMTYVYCVYDASAVYFAFVCRDGVPEGIEARLVPRESGAMGDCVGIFLDTYYDRQNAFLFQTNARGVQADARVSQDGSRMDMSWDGIWRAEGRVTSRGWVVEIAIPFNTLRFPYSPDQVWGVQFWRYTQRLDESSYWVPVTRSMGFHVAGFGTLTGIKGIRHGLHLEALPYALARGETDAYGETKATADCGLDLKWGPAPDLTVDLTSNPDFGQIEADPEYINLSRYEYRLAERRPFFLEGKELIDSLFFYTRRIGKRLPDGTEVPVLAGARTTGKAYGTSFILTVAGTEGVKEEPPALYGAGGLRFDVLESSNFGFTVAGKDTSSGYAGCAAFDTQLRPLSRLEFAGRFARTWNTDKRFEGYFGTGGAWFRSANWSLGADYSDAGRDFYVEDFGYVPWYGSKSHNLWLRFHPQPNKMGIRSYSISLNHTMDKRYEHPLWSRYTGPLLSVILTNLWNPWIGAYFGKKFEEGLEKPYSNIYAGMYTDARKPLSAGIVLRQYDLYNYAEYYFGHARTGSVQLEVRPASNIQLSSGFENVREYREDWTLDRSSWTANQRLKIPLTRQLHLRLYALENTRTERYTANGLVEWEFAPKSRIYLAFNEVRSDSTGDMNLEERVAFVKISYLLSI